MSDIFCLSSFESFALFEDSNLSQLGLPKEMITKIHTKEEHHTKEYPQMGHTYKSRAAVPMPYQYFIPSSDIEIPEPLKLRGRKSNRSPFQDKEVKSEYTDFAWYLQSIPFGAIRIFFINKDINFFMFLYHKQPSKGATGEQYAVMAWDPERKKVIDYGYSELTTSGVDRAQLRGVHDTKGGNTNGKIQEYVRAVTRQGEKKYAPSLDKPLYVYVLPVNPNEEPRVTREERGSTRGASLSSDFMKVFASRFAKIIDRASSTIKERLINTIDNKYYSKVKDAEIDEVASVLGTDAGRTQAWLYENFKTFRKELFEEGRARTQGAPSAYSKTAGFELQKENQDASEKGLHYVASYAVQKKKFSPDEEGSDPETGFREAQPEKYKRELPIAGEYASIPSMISKHTLDGLVDKFTAFLVTGKIKTPNVSIAGILGIKDTDVENEFKRSSSTDAADSEESWLF
ncbi:hypothetical protein UFOVP1247_145 [uncultured Caudovirales phage]|uniref:Uncharacterized protein n=1 Tax=uncultured Caudovirales phage TaxID=2100421 RepID=A0A6J5Q1X0_9CAUD|nr:hypothetical protein UFOVP970_185 [uncultured Caudovirales phage]CAB4193766.1 hypothetical protein UFOVP1247_145 [uncultured Caudovirales phage]